MPSPQAVPSTRTTLDAALRTPARLRTRGSSGSVGTGGPASAGNGSIRASAFRTVRGGTIESSRRSTSERCAARRRIVLPGKLERHHAEHPDGVEPDQAPANTPATESASRKNRRSRRRTAAPSVLPSSSNATANPTAPASAIAGE